MTKAKKRDYLGAIQDYTETIDIAVTPSDVKAMVLYNRALMYLAVGDDLKGVNDLEAVSTISEAPTFVKAMAKQKLVRHNKKR